MELTWLEVAVDATHDTLDHVCAALTAGGMDTFVVEDEVDFQRFLEENRQYWDYVDQELADRMKGLARVKFYVTDDADGRALLERYTAALTTPYSVHPLGENDWAHSWQKYYKPLPVGRRLYIVPEWERDQPLPQGKVPLYLNPGLTFGTGSHASTQLCLEGLERIICPGDRVLDLGCGSGVLSIAALALGASYALGVDIDPKAAGVSAENAALNAMGPDRFSALAGDVLSDGRLRETLGAAPWRVVLANIVADVIIPLAPVAPSLLAEDGVFLCSGIIGARADEVAAALAECGLRVFDRREKNDWVALMAQKG